MTFEQQSTGGEAPPDLDSTSPQWGFPVNRRASPDSVSDPTTPDGSGRPAPKSSENSNPSGCCSRTCPACAPWGSEMFSLTSMTSGTSAAWATSALVQWAHHTHGTGCSVWPTPRASDADRGGVLGRDRHYWNLCDAVRNTDGPGRVNPDLMEWLMGFPPGWTDVGPSETP